MTQYISKSTVVAEIERRLDELYNLLPDASKVENGSITTSEACNTGKYTALESFRSYINTIEVKEVDLEKETTHYLLYEHHSPLNEIMHKADLKSEMQYHKDIENAFKAGFELGMHVSNKAQKGE